jgi:FlaA1/EpsC-like NDP-sugar epimerase
VEAVLACGKAACDGRILLPKVGEPKRIAELAESLVRAAGKKIQIQFTGLRPGDKLTEELTYPTEVKEGFVEGGLEVVKTRRLGRADLEDVVEQLAGSIARRDCSGLIRTLSSVVPEYAVSRAAGVLT